MRLPSIAFLISLSIILTGCGSTYSVKTFYEGAERPRDQIALVYLDPHVLVVRVDQQRKDQDGKRYVLASSAGKRRDAIALLPGNHEIETQFSVLCLASKDFVTLKFVAEAGKSYRLKSELTDNNRAWVASLVEYHGEEIEDTVDFTSAMCPMNVQFIYLPSRAK